MRSRILGIALGLALAAPALAPVPAFADWTHHVAYRRDGQVCKHSADGTTKIQGGVFQKEIGKRGVTGFKIVWKLYTTNPKDVGSRPKLKKTVYSASFQNTATSYAWTRRTGKAGGGGNWYGWQGLNGTHEYWLQAKMVWIRSGLPRNWSHTLPVTYCDAHGISSMSP